MSPKERTQYIKERLEGIVASAERAMQRERDQLLDEATLLRFKQYANDALECFTPEGPSHP